MYTSSMVTYEEDARMLGGADATDSFAMVGDGSPLRERSSIVNLNDMAMTSGSCIGLASDRNHNLLLPVRNSRTVR
jgi:hypothetical protein